MISKKSLEKYVRMANRSGIPGPHSDQEFSKILENLESTSSELRGIL